MISKNKKLFLKIYIPFVIIISVALIILQILGSKNRVGYLTDFKLNVAKTLELNNLENINNELDEEGIKNYLLTNENITNYVHHFRIRYYDKNFRNNDIYGVYPDLSNLPDYMQNAEMEEDGSPYGNFISDKKEIKDKIDNVNYVLKIKHRILAVGIVMYIIPFIILIFKIYYNIIRFLFDERYKKYRSVAYKIYSIFLICFIFITIILALLGNIQRKALLENFELVAETPAGYVYKAYVSSKGFFAPNFLYKYSKETLSMNKKPDYIKNYGYSYYINKKPNLKSCYGNNIDYDGKVFTVSNSVSWDYPILISTGEQYRILIKLSNENKAPVKIGLSMSYFISEYNALSFSYLSNTYDNYEIYGDDVYIYDAIHTESILNFSFPNEKIDIKYISIEQINNDALYIKDNSYIVFTSYIKDIDKENIPILYVKLDISQYYTISFIFSILLYLIFFIIHIYNRYNLKSENNIKLEVNNKLVKNDYLFIYILTSISILLFIFQYWLFFPGYFIYWDTWFSIQESISGIYSNQSGVIIPLCLHYLYKIFGYSNDYMLIINLILFQISLYLIILSLYLKFKNKFTILLLIITFIPNLLFFNMNHIKDSTASLWIFFSYSLIFLKINTNFDKKTNILITTICLISILLALLWRHNFIVTIYPIFILFTYDIIKDKSILKFISIMLIFAVILVLIHYSFPRIFTKEDRLMSNIATQHLFMLQIAGCSVPANDGSLIEDSWYLTGKNFEDVKKVYNSNPLNADQFTSYIYKERVFKYAIKSERLKQVWIKYIIRYPINYIKHIANFTRHLWTVSTWKVDPQSIQVKYGDIGGIQLTPLKYKIYNFLYRFLGDINILVYVIASIILFFITGLLYIKSKFRVESLLFSFCTAFSSVATAIITALFSPQTLYRYIHPVCPISILSLISFITFIYDRGGFRKFIKELRGEKK